MSDRLHRRVHHPGVSDHVGIGDVHDDDVVLFEPTSTTLSVSSKTDISGCRSYVATLGEERESGFAFELRVGAAVEEESHVRVLLGLGDAKLLETRVRQHFAEVAADRLRRKQHRQIELLVIAVHRETRLGWTARSKGVKCSSFMAMTISRMRSARKFVKISTSPSSMRPYARLPA